MAASCMSAQYCSPMGKVEAKIAAQSRASIFWARAWIFETFRRFQPWKRPKNFPLNASDSRDSGVR